jgi:hypothetical protein
MISRTAKILLFFSSYLPMWPILVVLYWGRIGCLIAIPIAAIVVGAAGILGVRRWVRTTAPTKFTIKSADRRDSDSVAYIVTYIAPFLTIVAATPQEVLGVALLFVVTMLVYVSSDMIYVNPTLTLAGVRMFAIETEEGPKITLLTSSTELMKKGDPITAVGMTDAIYWEKPGQP